MNPSNYKPLKATDFIGPARGLTETIDNIIEDAFASDEPFRLLLHGKPGVGKSSLATYAVAATGASKWSVHKMSGTQAKIEEVEELARASHYTSLLNEWRVIWFEEVDAMPRVAQIRFLLLADDLPKRAAVVATCNNRMDLEERYRTRFQNIEVSGPKTSELREFLASLCQLPEAIANQIAIFADGNVRAALNEAQTYLQSSVGRPKAQIRAKQTQSAFEQLSDGDLLAAMR